MASGSLLSVLLFYLAPLPILIAGARLEPLGGADRRDRRGALALAAVFGPMFFFAFLVGVGLPAWWLGYLALLARPAGGGDGAALEWYPAGRLVLWAAILGALVVVVAMPQPRHRRGQLPRRPAQQLRAHAARRADKPAGRAAGVPGVANPTG